METLGKETSPPRFTMGDVLHQAVLTAKGLYQFVRRPTSRQTFTALSEALVRFRANHDAVAFMLRDPKVAELCRERYVGRPYDLKELIQYPPGSLGHELAASMMKHNYDPEFYRDYYGQGPLHFKNDEEWCRFRIRQTHDIVHVITGFGATEFAPELGMQAFHAAQTMRPFNIALVGFGFLRIILQPDELQLTLNQIAKGLAMGYAARTLMGERFEDDWTKTVEEWRRELNLVDESVFEFLSSRKDDNRAASDGRQPESSWRPATECA